MSTQPNTLERIPIFLASPSDLSAERRIFYDVIEKVNKIKAKSRGILLEATGWEDTLPGKGRPQEMINQDLNRSHLVVMLLWKRWGSPTGIYSSGFEEEFEEAHADGKNIFLYFREIPSNMLVEPEEQLKKVLDFKTRIKDEKNYFYKEYKDEKDWENTFLNNLCLWLDQMRSGESQAERFENPSKNSIDIHQIDTNKGSLIKIDDGDIHLESISNPSIHVGNYEVPYFKIKTKDNLDCSLFGDSFGFSDGAYYFHISPTRITLEELKEILNKFYITFKEGYFEMDSPSFLINQVCYEKGDNYSWFGYGPKNFIRALEEQSRRYSEAGIIRPHSNEIAGFVASGQDYIFYIGLQPSVIRKDRVATLDMVQIGFVFGNLPFDIRRFHDFYKGLNLKIPDLIPDFIYQKRENLNSKREKLKVPLKLKNEGFIVYKSGFDGEYFVSKIICKNPYYNKINNELFEHEKIIVNLNDHHPLNMNKKYFLKELITIPIPYEGFRFNVLNIRGNW